MNLVSAAMARLADCRDEVLNEQSPADEARLMRAMAGKLRQALDVAGLSPRRFAERTGLALELVVALENGYGRLETARRVLNLARARRGMP
jgi:hypothetical protein